MLATLARSTRHRAIVPVTRAGNAGYALSRRRGGRRLARRGLPERGLRLRSRAARALARPGAPRRDGHGLDADHDRVHRRNRRHAAASSRKSPRSPRSAMRGEIDFAESLRERVALLAGLPVDGAGARLRRAPAPVARRGADARRTSRRSAPTAAARLRRLHVLHRPAEGSASSSTTRCPTRSKSSAASSPGASTATSSTPRAKAAMLRELKREAARSRRPRPSRSATAPTTCRCLPRPTSPSPTAPSPWCARRQPTRIDHCGLDGVLNLLS